MEKTSSLPLPISLLNAFNTNNRINQYLIDNLPPAAWKARPPGGEGRSIPAIVAHMQNVRVMWLKAASRGRDKDRNKHKNDRVPPQIDRAKATPLQPIRALEHSREALSVVLCKALDSDGGIKGFRPDVTGFVAYLIAHDAHHRGQITMLAGQVGFPLPQKAMFGMWKWNSR